MDDVGIQKGGELAWAVLAGGLTYGGLWLVGLLRT